MSSGTQPFKRHWPRSIPDYKYSADLLNRKARARHLIGALVFYFSYIVGLIAWFVFPKRSANLIIRTDGIGDALLFEPALRSFAQAFPEQELDVWAPSGSIELLLNHPQIHQKLIVPRGGKTGNIESLQSLRLRALLGFHFARNRYEIAMFPVQSAEPLGNYLVTSVRAKERWIADSDLQNQFDWQRQKTLNAATRVLPTGPAVHELDRNSVMASSWTKAMLDTPIIPFDPESVCQALQLIETWRCLANNHGARRLLAVIPATSMPVKDYPLSQWAKVIEQLWQTEGAICILLGGPDESQKLRSLSELLGDIPHIVSRELSLMVLARVVALVDVVLSTDTAAAHMALAQNVKTITLCGGGHPQRFLPWPRSNHGITLIHPMPCQGCSWRCKLAENECLTHITPSEIVSAYQHLVAQPRIPLRQAI